MLIVENPGFTTVAGLLISERNINSGNNGVKPMFLAYSTCFLISKGFFSAKGIPV
jgi:hypothetical protein